MAGAKVNRSYIEIIFLLKCLFKSMDSSSLIDYSCLHQNSWLLNEDHTYSSKFNAFTDVVVSGNLGGRWKIKSYGIPNYNISFTTKMIQSLNSRPNAATDFTIGQTIISNNEKVSFGDDIGYDQSPQRGTCDGYWPPTTSAGVKNKDGCPIFYSDLYSTTYFSLTPAPETSDAFTYNWSWADTVGRAVNGVLFQSGLSPKKADIWTLLAPETEKWNLDPCSGHAEKPDYEYHHHSHPNCLASLLGDNGSMHSPIYGFAVDGYPIYGPYQDNGTLAVSCWQKRDYSSALTGCAGGKRTCQLIDEYDYTIGVTTSGVSLGESFTSIIQSSNGNSIVALNGVYYQDYFYNSSCSEKDSFHLNEFNGHEHDDLGFHYHITLNTLLEPAFPYITGPRLYGCVPTYGPSSCGSSDGVALAKSTCLSSSNDALSAVTRKIVGTAILTLMLLAGFGTLSSCCIFVLRRRRHRRLSPNYEDGAVDVEMTAGLPTAEVAIKPKYPESQLLPLNIVTMPQTELTPEDSSEPVATATAIALQ